MPVPSPTFGCFTVHLQLRLIKFDEPLTMTTSIKSGWFGLVRTGEIYRGPTKKALDFLTGRVCLYSH